MQALTAFLEKIGASNLPLVVLVIALGVLAGRYPELGLDFPSIANVAVSYLIGAGGVNVVSKAVTASKTKK